MERRLSFFSEKHFGTPGYTTDSNYRVHYPVAQTSFSLLTN